MSSPPSIQWVVRFADNCPSWVRSRKGVSGLFQISEGRCLSGAPSKRNCTPYRPFGTSAEYPGSPPSWWVIAWASASPGRTKANW